jgi:hypothetical protein
MDHILKSKRFTVVELGDISRARLFYRALMVSNIANTSGTKIDEAYYSMDQPARQENSTWRCPTQPFITSKQCNLWEKAIKLTLTDKYKNLKQRLGK